MSWRKRKRGRQERREPRGIRTAYVHTYPDTGQTVVHVEWTNGEWTLGDPSNLHMMALLDRAEREGVRVLRYGRR